MPDAPKQHDFFGFAKQLGVFVGVLVVILIIVSAPVGALVYLKAHEQPGSDTTKLYRPGSGKCLPTAGQPYLEFFNAAGQKYTVDPMLVAAIANRESGFNPRAENRINGHHVGLMQVSDDKIGDSSKWFDPQTNINAGAAYIGKQLDDYGRNELGIKKALAAYNWGPGNVPLIGGLPKNLPAETSRYVTNVYADYLTYRKCQNESGTKDGQSYGELIVAKARTMIGKPNLEACTVVKPTSSNRPAQNACASVVASIINPIAHVNLTASVPVNWESPEGTRSVNSSVPGATTKYPNDRTMTLDQLRPGDYVFYAEVKDIDDIHHSGIYIGQYRGKDGKGGQDSTGQPLGNEITTNQGVVQITSADPLRVLVRDLKPYLESTEMVVIGIKRF